MAFLAARRISANQVTITAFVLSCLVGAAVGCAAPTHPAVYGVMPLFLFVRMALNAFDGMLAREYNQKPAWGPF